MNFGLFPDCWARFKDFKHEMGKKLISKGLRMSASSRTPSPTHRIYSDHTAQETPARALKSSATTSAISYTLAYFLDRGFCEAAALRAIGVRYSGAASGTHPEGRRAI